MAIVDTQVSKFVDMAINHLLQKGVVPSSRAINTRVRQYSERVGGGPMFRPFKVEDGHQFPITQWNRELEFVEFDLMVLYEELVGQALELMRRTSYAETTYRSQRGQLDRIISLMEDLEFTLSNSDVGFIGISDHLTDMDKQDIPSSTQGVQDLSEEAVLIPASPLGTERIKMDHKARSHIQEVKVIEPGGNQILSSFTSSNAPFSNCFQDLSLVWRHDIVTKSHEGKVTISVTFPVQADESLIQMSRVGIVPHSESKMLLSVQISNDGFNFVALPGGTDVPLDNMKIETNLDFARRSVRYVRLLLTKERPDERLNNSNRYSFGLRALAFIRAVRPFHATYQTVRMTPEQGQIERVALETEERIPNGSSIDYYVRAGTGEFLPIIPLGRSSGYAPKYLQFGKSQRVNVSFKADSPTLDSTINAVPIYSVSPALDTGDMTGDVIYGSAKMWRGRDAWHRNSGIEETARVVRDAYVYFGSDDEQSLWIWDEQEASYRDGINTSSESIGILEVTGDIFYEKNSGHRMVPAHNVDQGTDNQPTYAIAEIIAHRSASLNTGETISMSVGQTSNFTFRNVNESETISATVGVNTLQEGTHYELVTLDNDENYLNGQVKLLALPDSSTSANVEWEYTIRKDITHMVTRIERNTIFIFAPVDAEWFEMKFKTVPDDIVRRSVVVKASRGEAEVTYEDGIDYRVNVDSGSITRLARDGANGIQSGVFIDFQYRKTERNIDVYDCWVFVDREEPFKIEFSKVALDKVSGENFFLYTSAGKIDLTDSTETPLLSRGWYQFSTVSKPIETAGSAINLILALVDINSKSIFTGQEFFSELRAFRNPMVQTTENGLKYSTRKDDHTKFALVDGYVLTNFQPGGTEDLITEDYLLVEQSEMFELSYLAESKESPSDVTLRAILKRDPGTDQGVTPKLFWWAIRLRR